MTSVLTAAWSSNKESQMCATAVDCMSKQAKGLQNYIRTHRCDSKVKKHTVTQCAVTGGSTQEHNTQSHTSTNREGGVFGNTDVNPHASS